MYKDDLSGELSQGDVVDNFSYAIVNNPTFKSNEFSTQLRVKSGPVVLLSHDCDLEVYAKGPKRVGLIFAPLVPLAEHIRRKNPDLDPEEANKLDPEDPQYVSVFFYKPYPEKLEDVMMVDFSTMQSMPTSPTLVSECRRNKILELTEETKQYLQDKLMAHFGRVE